MSIPRKPFYVRAQGRESFPGKGTTMDTPDTSNAMPKVPDAVAVNKLIQEFMVARGAQRLAEVDAFANSSNRTTLLILEVFKGLIANSKA